MTAPEKQFALFLDDVRVPADALIGGEGEGLRALFSGLNPERIMAAALETGIARYALDKAAAYARERIVWDVPIGAHQGVAHPLASCKIEVELARLMTRKRRGCTTAASTPPRPPTWPSTRRPRLAWRRSIRRSRPTVATA